MPANLDEVTFEVESYAPANANFPNATGWTCTIEYQGKQMVVPFYMGVGLGNREPQKKDVLECIFQDVRNVGHYDDQLKDFANFMIDTGFNDPQKAVHAYTTCVNIRYDLERLFGDEYEAFEESVS